MTSSDILNQIEDWKKEALSNPYREHYHTLNIPAGQYVFTEPIEHFCSIDCKFFLKLAGEGSGTTRFIFKSPREYAIKSSRGYGDGPSFAMSGINLTGASPTGWMDGVVLKGVQRSLFSDLVLSNFRIGSLNYDGCGEITFRDVRILDSSINGFGIETTTTGACVLENVCVLNEKVTSDDYGILILSRRIPSTGGECNIDMHLTRVFGKFRGGYYVEGVGANIFLIADHCIADSADFTHEAWLIKDCGNVHLSAGSWGCTHGSGASGISILNCSDVSLTGCTFHGQNGPPLCIRASNKITMTGNRFTGKYTPINIDDISTEIIDVGNYKEFPNT